MNKAIDIVGGINVIRRMKISDFVNRSDITPEEKIRFATSCMHSPEMQEYYHYEKSG